MTTPINFNKARKARARAAKKARADTNAVAYGRSKAERDLAEKQQEAAKRALDQKRLDRPENGS